jgi:hypothetical protein
MVYIRNVILTFVYMRIGGKTVKQSDGVARGVARGVGVVQNARYAISVTAVPALKTLDDGEHSNCPSAIRE